MTEPNRMRFGTLPNPLHSRIARTVLPFGRMGYKFAFGLVSYSTRARNWPV